MAAAIGADPVRTEIIKAFIILMRVFRPGCRVEELRDFVRSPLARHEVPRLIESTACP